NNTVSMFEPGATTPTATLTGVLAPGALAFDASGNLYVANTNAQGLVPPVTVFAPGATSPSNGLYGPEEAMSLAFDSSGNLYVGDDPNGETSPTGTVSIYPPGASNPSATITGLVDPVAMAFDKHGNLVVVNAGNDSVTAFAHGTTTKIGTISGFAGPSALAF